VDGQVYLGGQDTELYSFSLSNLQLKQHPSCTDNGVAKIMSIGKLGHRKLLILSTEQNLTFAKISGQTLTFDGMLVGYND
jgi:hypothetical protein